MYQILRKLYKSKTVKIIRHIMLTEFLLCFLIVIVIMPYRLSLLLGRLLGLGICYIYKNYRYKVEENLKLAFADYPRDKIRGIRDKSYKNMGMNLVEFGLLNFRSKKFWLKKINIIGREIMEKHIRNKHGIVLLGAHIGNWELMGAYLAMLGYPMTIVAKELYDKRLNWLLITLRLRRGVKIIYRTGRANTKSMIAVLKRGEVLGILIDQDTKVGGRFVRFFGRPAYTPTAISQFARIKNTVVIPGFIYRRKDLRHQVVIMKQRPGGIDEKKETQEYTSIIEKFIRQHPSQWVWVHPRWKTKLA